VETSIITEMLLARANAVALDSDAPGIAKPAGRCDGDAAPDRPAHLAQRADRIPHLFGYGLRNRLLITLTVKEAAPFRIRGAAISPKAKVQQRKTKVQKPATIRDFWT